MSDGLNAEFMKNPKSFMSMRPIDIEFKSELAGSVGEESSGRMVLAQGIHDFDLEYSTSGNGAIHLRHFADRTKKATSSSQRISAYWLPWKSQGVAKITLGTGADFFFTSALGGCRIQIGAGSDPDVLHIAGNISQQQREKKARTEMGDGYEASRRFSSTQEYPASECAFLVGKAYVTGKTRRWRFFAQGIDVTGGKFIVVRLNEHQNGVLEV